MCEPLFEVFQPVEQYEDCYVTNKGRVFYKGEELKIFFYKGIDIPRVQINKKQNSVYILYANAFMKDEKKNAKQCKFIDKTKPNYLLDNIEWIEPKQRTKPTGIKGITFKLDLQLYETYHYSDDGTKIDGFYKTLEDAKKRQNQVYLN